MIKGKLFKYYEYFVTKLMIILKQRTFSCNDVSLKYIFEKADSNNLIVIFSSCTRVGVKARYNYMRTLSGIKANKLFILDNFSPDGRGSWYVGRNGTFSEEYATEQLISKYREELPEGKIVFCGSSKGGYAALDIGSAFENACIVAGAPQYYLAYYLRAPESEERLSYIMGRDFKAKMPLLDNHLASRLEKCNSKETIKVYMHFSDREHTYAEHVRDLIVKLESLGYFIEKDIAAYTDHSDISFYFPRYLTDTLQKILTE